MGYDLFYENEDAEFQALSNKIAVEFQAWANSNLLS